jgi:hypothetical protein
MLALSIILTNLNLFFGSGDEFGDGRFDVVEAFEALIFGLLTSHFIEKFIYLKMD